MSTGQGKEKPGGIPGTKSCSVSTRCSSLCSRCDKILYCTVCKRTTLFGIKVYVIRALPFGRDIIA